METKIRVISESRLHLGAPIEPLQYRKQNVKVDECR